MKQKERIAKKLQTHHPGETMDGHDMELFKLSTIKSQQHLSKLENTETLEEELSDEEGVADELEGAKLCHVISISYLLYLDYSGEELSDSSKDSEDEQQKMDADSTDNPLIMTLDHDDQKGSKGKHAAHVWFQKPLFARLEDDRDMDTEVELSLRKLKNKRSHDNNGMMVKSSTEETTEVVAAEVKDVDVSDTDTDSDSIDSYEVQVSKSTKASNAKGDTFEVVPVEKSLKRPRHLDPEGLALGALLKKSKKSREDLIESGYNRWTNNDDNLPDWFAQDEAKHCQKQLPVTKEMVKEFKERLKEIDARPIKKIAEAKARKKRRTLRRLEKIKKRVQGVVDTPDALDSEKIQQLKKLYQKAKQGSGRSKEVQYVVAKKGIGKRVSRPAGVSGRFKVVARS